MSKNKILLCSDVFGWCWHWTALGIQKYSKYPCEVVTSHEFSEIYNYNDHLEGYDAVLQFGYAESISPQVIRSATIIDHPGWMYERNLGFLNIRLTTELRNRVAADRLFHFDTVLVKNESLRESISDLHPNVKRVNAGFDSEIFYPAPQNNHSKLVVGWCGQIGTLNQKGYHEILVPLMNRLGNRVEWRINDRDYKTALSPEEMREWYHGIDLFLCTSCAEGGPMPPLESLACGRNVLTTDCGFMAELPVIIPEQRTWKCEADVPKMIDAFEEHILAYEPFEPPSIDEWSWKRLADSWVEAIL